MNILRRIFYRGPSRSQHLVDLWHQDRAAAMAEAERMKPCSSMYHIDCVPMLELERFARKVEQSLFDEKKKRLRESAMRSSRFARLRMKAGLPFKPRTRP